MSVVDSEKVYSLHGSFSSGKEPGFRNGRFLRESKGVMLRYPHGLMMKGYKWLFENGAREQESVSFLETSTFVHDSNVFKLR